MPLKILGWGTINIQFLAENKIHLAQLQDVQHAPTAHNNIISIGWLTDHGYQAIFRNSVVKFQTPQGQTYAEGRKVKLLFQMHAHIKPNILHQPTKFYQIHGESDDEDKPA